MTGGDDVPRYSRQNVLEEAKRFFGASSVNGVVRILDGYTCEPEDGRWRVQMACLKLSEGDVNRLRHYVTQANQDFRDVLYWAEYYDR